MHKRTFLRLLVPAALLLALAWFPQPAIADDWQVSQWPQEPNWVAITNHLTACYHAVCQRYQAAGVNPASVPGPSFVYVYNDYVALGQALDNICGRYVVQTNADGNGSFDTWLAAHPDSNSLPAWAAADLHGYCGFTNWGNNSLLTSWDVCDHSIATQIVQACAVLYMTAPGAAPFNPATTYTNVMVWSGTNWSMAATNRSVHGPVAWPQGWLSIDNNGNITAARSGSRIGIAGGCYTGAVSTRTLYLKGIAPCTTWNPESFVGTLYTNRYTSRSASVSTSSATNSFLDDFTQGYGTVPFLNQGGPNTSEGWAVGSGFWVMNWQFSSVPQLPAVAAATIIPPDTDLDGLVNILKGPYDDLEPYGSICYLPDWNQPFVRIPLANAAPRADLGLKVELTSGRGQGLPYRYAVPGFFEKSIWSHYGVFQGPNIFLNTDTRVVEYGMVTNDSQHVKRVSILRPYGRLVVFDFPWTNGAFSVFGYPTGPDANRTYVLQDMSPENTSPNTNFRLLFQDGIYHDLGWDCEATAAFGRLNGGHYQTAPVNTTSPASSPPAQWWQGMDICQTWCHWWWYGGGEGDPVPHLSGVLQEWGGATGIGGAPDPQLSIGANLQYDGSIPQSVAFYSYGNTNVQVEIEYDDNGNIFGLSKSGSGAETACVAVDRGACQVAHSWGTESLTAFSQSCGGSSTISYAASNTTWSVARTFDTRGRLTGRTFSTGSSIATSAWTWYDDNGHYAGGAPMWSRLHTFTPPIGPTVTYGYDPANGWLTDVQTTWNGLPSEWCYDYTPLVADDMPIPADPNESPRTADWYVNGKFVRRVMQVCSNYISGSYDYLLGMNVRSCDSRFYGSAENQWSDSPQHEEVVNVGPVFADFFGLWGADCEAQRYGELTPSMNQIVSTATETDSWVDDGRSVIANRLSADSSSEVGNMYMVAISGVATNCEFWHWTDSGFIDTNLYARTLDSLGRPLVTSWFDGTTDSCDNYCLFGPQNITRRDQTTASIQYDAFGGISSISEPALGRVTTLNTDPLGLQSTLTVAQGGATRTATVQKDIYGRPVSYADPHTTNTWAYAQSGDGGWTITQHRSGLGDIVTETYADGGVRKVYGTGAQQCVGYAWSVQNGTGLVQTATLLNANGSATPEFAATTYSALGLPASFQQAGIAGVATVNYDTAGQPLQLSDKSGITQILVHDPVIGIASAGVKIAGDPATLLAAGSDRMMSQTYAIDNSGNETRTANTFLANGSDAATQLLGTFNSIDGRQASLNFAGRTASVQASPFTGPAAFTLDTSLPGGASTHATYGPLGLASLQKKDASGNQTRQTTIAPDPSGLSVQIQDTLRGQQSLLFDLAGRLLSIDASSAGGQSTTIEYLPGTDLPTSITGGGKTWTCQYYPNGLPHVVSVSGQPTATLTWDTMGRLATMALNPSGSQTVVTAWNRDAQTGRLVNKTVNGAVVETYAWRANGQPDTLARANGTLSHQYNAAGDCTGVADTLASGSAENITIAYDRPGNLASLSVSNGVGEAYVNNLDGSVASVQVTGSGVAPDHSFTLPQDLSCGQALGFSLALSNGTRTCSVAYGPAATATNVTDGAIGTGYTWCPGGHATNLLSSLAGVPILSQSMQWNEALGVRSNMTYRNAAGAALASFAFERGPGTNRISAIMREDGSRREVSYDGSGRLSGWKYKNATGVADYDRSFVYAYDDANNLISVGHDPAVAGGPPQLSPMARDYATKNIRTISQFDVDAFNLCTVRRWGAVDLVCMAVTNARVTVNGMPARQNGTRFVVSIPLAQNSPAQVTNLIVCAVISVSTNLEYYFTNAVALTLPAFPETITTALGSAVLSDSTTEYLYDSRNQLRRVTDKDGATAIRLQSVYDYYPDGRRARKTVTRWDGSAWQPYRIAQYIWDRWDLVREIVQENDVTTTRDYAWGLDLAGLQDGQWAQDAGGVGGLLAITEVATKNEEPGTTNLFFTICDQVGTVHALVAAMTNNVALATPVVVASFEYEPYGRLVSADGPYVGSCSIGFMSKVRDSETELVYFGGRYYNPRDIRWMTVDNMGEAGGANLIVAFADDPVNNFDARGADSVSISLPHGGYEKYSSDNYWYSYALTAYAPPAHAPLPYVPPQIMVARPRTMLVPAATLSRYGDVCMQSQSNRKFYGSLYEARLDGCWDAIESPPEGGSLEDWQHHYARTCQWGNMGRVRDTQAALLMLSLTPLPGRAGKVAAVPLERAAVAGLERRLADKGAEMLATSSGNNIFWHGSEAAVASREVSGILVDGPGNGGLYWATSKSINELGVGAWKIGGDFNVKLLPPNLLEKGGIEATYTLTPSESAMFSRAWGTDFSWNPYSWLKGTVGQYYYRPLPATATERLLQVGEGVGITGAGYGLYELGK